MNVSRLVEFARLLLELEGRFNVQKRLGKISGRIQEIISAPQDVQHQTNTLATVGELRKMLEDIAPELNQPMLDFLSETGGRPYFETVLVEGIEQRISSSGITPAVAKSFVDEITTKRNQYIEHLKAITNQLKALGFKEYPMEPGQAEIGFKIPRALFGDNPRGLADELKFIDFTVYTFAEAVTGKKEHGKIAQLSTSDPIVLLTAGVAVVAALGKSVKYLLELYAEYLKVLKLKAELEGLKMSNGVIKELEERAKKILDEGVDRRVEQILSKKKPVGREAEIAVGLGKAMHGLLARVERGMTVEVRFLPPKLDDQAAAAQTDEDRRQAQELVQLQKDLVFPAIPEKPLLAIPEWPAKDVGEKQEKKPRKKRKKKGDFPDLGGAVVDALAAGGEQQEPKALPNGEGNGGAKAQ